MARAVPAVAVVKWVDGDEPQVREAGPDYSLQLAAAVGKPFQEEFHLPVQYGCWWRLVVDLFPADRPGNHPHRFL